MCLYIQHRMEWEVTKIQNSNFVQKGSKVKTMCIKRKHSGNCTEDNEHPASNSLEGKVLLT